MAQTNVVTLFLRGNAKSLVTAMTSAETKVSRAVTGMAKAFATVGPAAALAFGQVVKRGSEVERAATSFEKLTSAVGLSGDAMLEATRVGTKGLIADMDIMSAANKGLLLGLPLTETGFGEMAAAATSLGQAMGQDATKSLDDLIIALGRSSPMILDNLGLTVKVGDANQKYAAQLGKSSTELTEAEKKQAFFNAAMDAARIKTAQLGGVQVTAIDKTTQLTNRFQNWFDSLARGAASLGPIAGGLGAIANKAGSAGFAIAGMGPVITGMGGWSKVMGAVGKASKAMWLAVTGPAGLAIAALVAVGTAVYVFRDKIEAALGTAADAAEEWSIRTGDALVDTDAKFLQSAKAAKDATGEWIESLAAANKAEQEIPGKLSPFYTAMKNKASALRKGADAALISARALGAEAEAVRKGIIADREATKQKQEKAKLSKEAAAAAEKEAKSIAALTRQLKGLPTLKAMEDARLLRAAWGSLSDEERALAGNTDRLAQALDKLRDQSVQLTAEEARLANIYNLLSGIADLDIEAPDIDWGEALDGAEKFGGDVPIKVVAGIGDGGSRAGKTVGDQLLSTLGQIDVGGTLARAFEGAGGFLGAVKSLASQVAGAFLDALGGWLNKGIGGVMSALFGGGGGGGAIKQAFGGAGSLGASSFIGGLFGGGAAAGVSAGVPLGVSAGVSAAVPGVTGASAAGGGLFGGISAGFGKIAAAIPGWGWAAAGAVAAGVFVWKMFGGRPSKLEQEGRKAAAGARTAIAETLDDGQVKEAAGNMANAVHIAIRDAMIGAGRSIKEAESKATEFVRKLWLAEKEGPEAVKAIKDEITGLISALADTNSELNQTFRNRSFTVTQRLRTVGGHSPIHAEERQHGGPVLAGRPYIVGERRPELFVPNQSGTILPRTGERNQRPIEITLVNRLDRRTLSKELIRVQENTLDFYGY